MNDLIEDSAGGTRIELTLNLRLKRISAALNCDVALTEEVWNDLNLDQFRALFHARRRQVTEIGNTCSSV